MQLRPAIAALLVLTLCAAAPAWADPTETPSAADDKPERVKLANELLAATHYEQTMVAILQDYRGALASDLLARGAKSPDDAAHIVDDVLLPDLRNRIPEYLTMLSEAYAEELSLADLQALLAFNQTPLGIRMNAIRTALGRKAAAAQQVWWRDVVVEAMRSHAAELRARGLKISMETR